jgi:guanylate kinase
MSKRGKVIVITAPSGTGKTTLARKLMSIYKNIVFSVSATTRPPREGEVHGKDYYFLSKDEFREKVENGDFLEWEEFYNGSLYGSLRSDVEYQLNNGYFVLFDVEVNGARNIKNIYGNQCLAIFIMPPDMETLRQRLMNRGTENEETLKLRLERASMELRQAREFDHTVINKDFDKAFAKVSELVIHFIKH